MSKQSDAKTAQGYVAKAVPKVCSNCASFRLDREQVPGYGGGFWIKETNMRCDVGGFAVKKMGVCKQWMPLPPAPNE